VHNLNQSQSNRCHTIKSREAAYSLMDVIISTNNDPEIINSLFETFWAPYIMQLSL
jgi:ubiquitin carboxyl-terminal hydrolase 34